jgi:hypothetical protein
VRASRSAPRALALVRRASRTLPMNLTPAQVASIVAGGIAYFALLFFVDRGLSERARTVFRYVAVAATVAIFFIGTQRLITDHARGVDTAKAFVALLAAAAVFYEAHRIGSRRPVAERWKKFVGVTLGIAAIALYFNGFKFGYAKYYHRWDQYHYYMGAKYFREMGYDGLYKCSLIAQSELGAVTYEDNGKKLRLDMKKEVEHPDKKIRNLGGDNLLMPAASFLEQPEQCRDLFSEARWKEYKEDVTFFRTQSDKTYWEDMQKDHGYNPPPAWTIMGHFFAEMYPAGERFDLPIIGRTYWTQLLAMLDIVYLAGTFVALWWAFGWRVFAVGAIFWGCQSSAPFYWTGGAFLRQDWLFFLVLSTCLFRKRYFALGGAAVVYAGMLRVFPGLVVIGLFVVAAQYIYKHKRPSPDHARAFVGGLVAALVIGGVSVKVAGTDSYQQFFEHTIKVHDQTPLTNHMGLRVLVAQKTPIEIRELTIGSKTVDLPDLGVGPESGRMKYTKDVKLTDPFEVWKRMRNERYQKLRYAAYAISLVTFVAFAWLLRRVKSLWIAQCIGQIWIILLSQLTCYYYSFMILTAPLTKVRRGLEAPLFGLTALSQFVWMTFFWNDDKYWVLTLISLVFCYGVFCAFWAKKVKNLPEEPSDESAPAP